MYPRGVPRIKDETREQRRQQLLDAAWRCVAEHGYRNASVDAVCAEAGVSKGAFYTYFATKQDLLLALLDDDAAGLGELVERSTDATTGITQVRQFLADVVKRGSDPAVVQLRADLWAELTADPDLRERFLAGVTERRLRLSRQLAAASEAGELVDVPANALAAVLLALADGLMLHRALDPGAFRWANVGRALDVLLDGLAPR